MHLHYQRIFFAQMPLVAETSVTFIEPRPVSLKRHRTYGCVLLLMLLALSMLLSVAVPDG